MVQGFLSLVPKLFNMLQVGCREGHQNQVTRYSTSDIDQYWRTLFHFHATDTRFQLIDGTKRLASSNRVLIVTAEDSQLTVRRVAFEVVRQLSSSTSSSRRRSIRRIRYRSRFECYILT
jgi:hypothetical protein